MSCPLKSRLILLNTVVKHSIKAFGFAHNLSDSYTLPMEYTIALLEIKYRIDCSIRVYTRISRNWN